MAIKRLVGIDFGTSTSVIKCKRYKDGKALGDPHHTESVTFGQGASEPRAMTIVRVNEDGTVDCGIDELLDGSTVYRDFKMSLESENEEVSQRAKELTHEYMRYLYERYSYQDGFLGECDEEETIISFPVKWKAETRRFMTGAVADAGFKNVSSIDEPSAALYAILAQEMNEIRNNGFIEKDKDNLILVIDMGAGTTDLAVCKCNVNAEKDKVTATDIKNELMFSWPKDDVDITFGGREIDEKLKDFLVEYVVSCGLPKEAAENFIRNNTGVKGWKEETLSPSLGKNESTKACTVAKQAQLFAPIKKPFPEITRKSFEKLIEDKLEDYKTLVKGCLDKIEDNAEIDVVIFTGGHSAWYFAKELVDGTMEGIDHPALRKVRKEKKRVFSLPHPQETVALGMVYSQLPFKIINTRVKDTKVTIPDFVNTSYERFTSNRVKNEDFRIRTVYEYSQTVGKGYVISQSIKPGEMVEKGTEITFVISRGAKQEDTADLKSILISTFAGYPKSAKGEELRKNMGISADETIYFAKSIGDLSESEKAGTVITEKGIYATDKEGKYIFHTKWDSFVNATLQQTENALIQKNGTKENVIYGEADQSVLEMFNVLQKQLITSKVVLSGKESTQPKSGKGNLFDKAKAYLENNKKIAEKLSSGNIDGLRTNLNIPENEVCYFWKDTTWFGSGKNGFVITDKGFYYRELWSNTIRLHWYAYRDEVTIIMNEINGIIAFGFKGGRQYTASFSTSEKSQALNFFVGLQNALKKTDYQVNATGTPEKSETNAQKTEDKLFLEIIEETCKAMCGPVKESDFYKLRNNLKVPSDAKIFFADSEYADTQKRGVMITDRGIYSTHYLGFFFGDVVHFTSWKEFLNGELIEHPVDGMRCKVGSKYNTIYYGTKKKDFMKKLYVEIKENLLASGIKVSDKNYI